jgi:phosphopantetheinyl transferase
MSGMRVTQLRWPQETPPLNFSDVDVVVCTASLCASDADVEQALDILSSDERVRFAGYTNTIVARRYAVGRRILRELLGCALGVSPASLPLREGLHGKPYLARESGDRALWFSVAHSEELIAVAMSQIADVGLDLERARSIEQWQRVADRVLDRSERAQLDCAVEAGEDAGNAFLRHWCRVEAELKAIGCGIAGLEDHRAGVRPPGLQIADLPTLPLPDEVAAAGVHYQAAVALCSPWRDNLRQIQAANSQVTMPRSMPAIPSTP